jgi:hypothetical protein
MNEQDRKALDMITKEDVFILMRSLLTNEQKNHLFSKQFGDFDPIALVSMGDMGDILH